MIRLFKFTGAFVWVAILSFSCYWCFTNFKSATYSILSFFGLCSLIVVFFRIRYGENWFLEIGKKYLFGGDLVKATENLLNEIPKPSSSTSADFIANIIYRFNRLGLYAFIIALIPIVLLFNQNQLIGKQNEKIDFQNVLFENQNERIEQQTYLQEAERRSSLVFLFSNIMDAIDKELKDDIGILNVRDLTPQLIGRISALSHRLNPYYYLEGDSLVDVALSPERGQLLVTLIESKLDSTTYRELWTKSSFKHSDLEGVNFSGSDLSNIELSGSNLSNAKLLNCKFNSSNLNFCDLNNINFYNSDLTNCQLANCTIQNGDFRYVDLTKANMSQSDLSNSLLSNATLHFTVLRRTNLTNTDLINVKHLARTSNKNVDIIEMSHLYGQDSIIGLSNSIRNMEIIRIPKTDYKSAYEKFQTSKKNRSKVITQEMFDNFYTDHFLLQSCDELEYIRGVRSIKELYYDVIIGDNDIIISIIDTKIIDPKH